MIMASMKLHINAFILWIKVMHQLLYPTSYIIMVIKPEYILFSIVGLPLECTVLMNRASTPVPNKIMVIKPEYILFSIVGLPLECTVLMNRK